MYFAMFPSHDRKGQEYEGINIERETRNFQRLFRRGYIDIMPTTKVTKGIAGYMAKYMAKNMRVGHDSTRRYYNTSRNIEKIYSGGSNSLSGYTDMIVGDNPVDMCKTYDTIWLGRCDYKKYNVISHNE